MGSFPFANLSLLGMRLILFKFLQVVHMVWSNNSSVLVWENDSEEKKQLLKLLAPRSTWVVQGLSSCTIVISVFKTFL